jgi:hypothetical protein
MKVKPIAYINDKPYYSDEAFTVPYQELVDTPIDNPMPNFAMDESVFHYKLRHWLRDNVEGWGTSSNFRHCFKGDTIGFEVTLHPTYYGYMKYVDGLVFKDGTEGNLIEWVFFGFEWLSPPELGGMKKKEVLNNPQFMLDAVNYWIDEFPDEATKEWNEFAEKFRQRLIDATM